MIQAAIFLAALVASTAAFTYSSTRLFIDNFMSFREAKILPILWLVSLAMMSFNAAMIFIRIV